ncbi:hypothetical protein AX16_008606 [Volvariella volvacea WC 439]|nr:hypothetical protein AX16_008606 [Volvariella volvacea WC 439]
MSTRLDTLSGCKAFLETATPEEIASKLRRDQNICRSPYGHPSLLVFCLPSPRTPVGDGVARALATDTSVPLVVSRLQYTSIIQGIKTHLANLHRDHDGASQDDLRGTQDNPVPPHLIPTDADFESALKVLNFLSLPPVRLADAHTPLTKLEAAIQSQLASGAQLRSTNLQSPYQANTTTPSSSSSKPQKKRKIHKPRLCYICNYQLRTSHPLYPSLCTPCGSFNISEASLSLPENLNLSGKTALITGGRVNLGYHVALRLLRCGARVIASSRYPLDAETRYLAEPDSASWSDRLKIVGADFRTAADVFALVKAVKTTLDKEWGVSKLDILVNNAAQTLTDSVGKESESILREQELGEVEGGGRLVVGEANYIPRVRGGATASITYERETKLLEDGSASTTTDTNAISGSASGGNQLILQSQERSSWVQKLDEIPYEDVISAHSVNTFVPLILVRELLSIMHLQPSSSSTNPTPKRTDKKPVAYIINVSSREGLPERAPSSIAKSGHHVHTNMSKAALNMLTETEASRAWRQWRIAINSVDPGYMSADPQWMKMVMTKKGKSGDGDEDTMPCPIGWEDGAGRVLWVVAKGENENVSIWGRFLKHFASVHSGR